MRFTIGKKLNSMIVTLQVLSIGGTVFLATRLFTDDLSGLLRKGTLDEAAQLSGRVRSEMKSVADKIRMLGTASLEEFRYPEDRLKYLQDNLAADKTAIGLSLYRIEDATKPAKSQWRIVHPEFQKKLSFKPEDFTALDQKHPIQSGVVSKGDVDFVPGSLADGTPILRMAIPFVQKSDGNFSQFLVVELHQERLTALFAESTGFTNALLDRNGKVMGTSDATIYPLGMDLASSPLFQAISKTDKQASGQTDFKDAKGEAQMGAFQKVGFAGLSVITHVPVARAQQAQKVLFRRTGLLAGFFLSLAFALGFLFSRSITEPVQALASAADKVKSGDFSVRLKLKTEGAKNPNSLMNRLRNDEIEMFSGTFNEMVAGLEEREKIKTTFAKFHSKEMAEKVLSGELKLGGERKNAVVFFSDVRGFTAMSEGMDPEALVQVLNRYMTRMVRIILEHGGVVDKYVGDAIMAVWGAPVSKDNDVYNSVMACLRMRESLNEFNNELIAEGKKVLKIGMGLNYGPLIAGNIGSEERMEYTVIGDTVNTASRVESVTKTFGTDFLISQAILDQVRGKFVVEKASEAQVKGKTDALILYKVHGYVNAQGQEVIIQTPYSAYEAEKSDKVKGGPAEHPQEHKEAAAPPPPPPAIVQEPNVGEATLTAATPAQPKPPVPPPFNKVPVPPPFTKGPEVAASTGAVPQIKPRITPAIRPNVRPVPKKPAA